ncbi:MAG: rRNA maturation RNase YbeY [Ammonifex sp.]|jgi:rRNA maturation RNase YbeY|nr:MAG: rRNA maturation RNase YbeY [Ammonifex sp.]
MTVIVQNRQEKVPVTDVLGLTARRAAEAALNSAALPGEVELGITFVDDAAMQELNHRYRGKNEPTDVLSFPMGEEEPQEDGSRVLLLGDVVVSLETALRSARALQRVLAEEVAKLVVHGTLHLLGCDHETGEDAARMRGKEEEILNTMVLNPPGVE